MRVGVARENSVGPKGSPRSAPKLTVPATSHEKRNAPLTQPRYASATTRAPEAAEQAFARGKESCAEPRRLRCCCARLLRRCGRLCVVRSRTAVPMSRSESRPRYAVDAELDVRRRSAVRHNPTPSTTLPTVPTRGATFCRLSEHGWLPSPQSSQSTRCAAWTAAMSPARTYKLCLPAGASTTVRHVTLWFHPPCVLLAGCVLAC